MNLKELFNNKEYRKIIELTKDSKDPNELFIRLSSFIQLSEYDNAVSLIENNRETLEKAMPFKLMRIHVELLLTKGDFAKAKKEAEHYKSLPYVSQEVEEYLSSLPELIDEAEHAKAGEIRFSYDEIDDVLTSSQDMGEIARILFQLEDYNINKLIPAMDIFLIREEVHPNLRTYALILLVQNRVDDTFQFLHGGVKTLVNPSRLNPPYNDAKFKEAFNLLNEMNRKDPSLKDVAVQLFNNYILDTYPEDVLENENLKVLAEAVTEIARSYLSVPAGNISPETKKKAEEVKAVIEKTPPLVF